MIKRIFTNIGLVWTSIAFGIEEFIPNWIARGEWDRMLVASLLAGMLIGACVGFGGYILWGIIVR